MASASRMLTDQGAARWLPPDPAVCSAVPPVDAEILERSQVEALLALLGACLDWDDADEESPRDLRLARAISQARRDLLVPPRALPRLRGV